MACAAGLVYSAVGSKFYVSLTAPATCDQAGFESLSWTEVKEITSIGAFGGATTLITHEPIGNQIVGKKKGNTNFGTVALDMARVESDAGQALLQQAGAYDYSDFASFRVQHNNIPSGGTTPTNHYFQGLVMSDTPVNIGTVNDIVNQTVNIEVASKIIQVDAA